MGIFRGSLAFEFSCFCLIHAAGRSPPFAMHLDRARSFCVYSSLYAAGRFPPFAVRLDRAQLLCLCFCLDAAGRCSYSPFMLGRCFWYFASPSGHLSAPVVAQRSRRHYVPASDVAALLISLFAQAAKACSLMANEFAQSRARLFAHSGVYYPVVLGSTLLRVGGMPSSVCLFCPIRVLATAISMRDKGLTRAIAENH